MRINISTYSRYDITISDAIRILFAITILLPLQMRFVSSMRIRPYICANISLLSFRLNYNISISFDIILLLITMEDHDIYGRYDERNFVVAMRNLSVRAYCTQLASPHVPILSFRFRIQMLPSLLPLLQIVYFY